MGESAEATGVLAVAAAVRLEKPAVLEFVMEQGSYTGPATTILIVYLESAQMVSMEASVRNLASTFVMRA